MARPARSSAAHQRTTRPPAPARARPHAPAPTPATGSDVLESILSTQDADPERIDASAVLRLQRMAGNGAVGRLLERTPAVQRDEGPAGAAPAAPAPGDEDTHEVLRLGDGPDLEVGQLQQALNAVGAAFPPLRITAVFGPETAAAVIAFQVAHPPLVPDGVAGLDTWARLDELAPRVSRQGRSVVEGPAEAAPRGVPSGGTTHPTTRHGSSGAAVEELQQKLNTIPADQVPTLLVVDGKFGNKTRAAVREFQRSRTPPLDVDGVVGPLTWAALDAVAGPVTVGREEFEWRERVEGSEYFGETKFTWRLLPDRMQVTVNIRFTGAPNHPRVAEWRGHITSVWNTFKFVDDDTPGMELPLEFVVGTGPADATVRVVVTPPDAEPGRSDAANWHTGDTDIGLAPHEFGHLIGLQDEYNQGPEVYATATGEQGLIGGVDAPTDPVTGDPIAPETIAAEIRTAVMGSPASGRGAATRAIVATKYRLTQGAFSQRVGQAYELANAGNLLRADFVTGVGDQTVNDPAGTIANDIAARIPGRTADETVSVRPFLYSNRGIMGEMQSLNQPRNAHDHPVAERHVRHFLELLRRNRPGRWRTVR